MTSHTSAPHAFLMDEYAGHEDAVTAAARQQVRQIGLSGVRSLRELVEVQAGYNDAIRRVGTDAGVVVVDLVPVYRAHAAEHLFTAMDVIHPNQRGHAIEAEALYRQMLDRGVLRAPANAKSADPAR